MYVESAAQKGGMWTTRRKAVVLVIAFILSLHGAYRLGQRSVDASVAAADCPPAPTGPWSVSSRSAYEDYVNQIAVDVSKKAKEYSWSTYSVKGLTMQRPEELARLRSLIESLVDAGVCGDVYETGTWRAGTAIYMAAVFRAYESLQTVPKCPPRRFWYFDSFEGFKPSDDKKLDKYLASKNYVAPLEVVRESFASFGLNDDNIHLVKGYFEDTMRNLVHVEPIALLRLDGDLYSSTKVVMDKLYPFVVVKGWVVVDDYDWHPKQTSQGTKLCKEAIDEYREEFGIVSPLVTEFGKPSWEKRKTR